MEKDLTINNNVINADTADVCDVIANLSDGMHIIKVIGENYNNMITKISSALRNSSQVKVNLDLSETTGLTEIRDSAFYNCQNLQSITIPDGVTKIGNEAFCGCNKLQSITIPGSVTQIGEKAFFGCKSLTTVNYKGTQEDWEKINIGKNNHALTKKATINYNYEE